MNRITVIPSKVNPGMFVFFDKVEQITFGRPAAYEDAVLRADAENKRREEFENIRLAHIAKQR